MENSTLSTKVDQDNKKEPIKCFVILPFSGIGNDRDSDYWEDFYKKFIKEPLEKDIFDKLTLTVSKHERSSGNTVNEILPQLIDSELVIAVLTDLKPNVIYELGIRHATKHGTILAVKKSVLQESKNKFSNLSNYTIIEYEDYDQNGFIKQLQDIINKNPINLWKDSDVLIFQKNSERKDSEKTDTFNKLNSKFSELRYPEYIKLNILWLDNYSQTVSPIIDFLLKKKANVTFSVNTQHFIKYLREQTFNVIISDMREGANESEGIANFKSFKKGQCHKNTNVPYIIFAGDSSMHGYRDMAIKAGINNENLISDPGDLVKRLFEIASLANQVG